MGTNKDRRVTARTVSSIERAIRILEQAFESEPIFRAIHILEKANRELAQAHGGLLKGLLRTNKNEESS